MTIRSMKKISNSANPPAAAVSPKSHIIIRGAKIHNLKNISLDIPRNKLIVFTGVSGSGKSSLAFDTIYAEGQRRYVESLSAYARQFLERMNKPEVDSIQGMSPAIAIEQKTSTRNPRSTVATTTEIYDYLRLLFARVGRTFCHLCGDEVVRDSVQSIVDTISKEKEGSKFYITFPMRVHAKHSLKEELTALKSRGFFRLIVNGALIDLNEQKYSSPTKEGIFVLVDRYILRASDKQSAARLADSIQTAQVEGDGYCSLYNVETQQWIPFSLHFECARDASRFEEPHPQLFSFNSPVGACPVCQGFGRTIGIDMDLVVPDRSKSIRAGAIHPWNTPNFREFLRDLLSIAHEAKIPVNEQFRNLTESQIDTIMKGYGRYKGIDGFFEWIEKKAYKVQYRVLLSRYRGYTLCHACNGSRLRNEAANVKIDGKQIGQIAMMTISHADQFFSTITLSDYELSVGKRILAEIRKRLRYLVDVGLGYLTLDRLSSTLSGGESQRINLATSIGSALVGSIYVLDEPSIGLHPTDNARLINILQSLRDIGNTVIVVEHDAEMMRAADVIVDLGPHAGENGGEITFIGTEAQAVLSDSSLTGQYLCGKKSIPLPKKRRMGGKNSIVIRNAFQHNLKNIDVDIPLDKFVCITGVSGSGKSTLVHDVLYSGLKKRFGISEYRSGGVGSIEGIESINAVELVDQSPIGRSPRSNPATYIDVFSTIRDLLAGTHAARIKGLHPGYFSFNIPGGRCDLCEGDGVQKIEMQFMADLYLPCESCKGKRYKKDALEIRFHGKNVDDILGMTVNEAIAFFGSHAEGKRVAKKLEILENVGLGYIRLGQPATTLSGGEAQRVKLGAHLALQHEGKILFIFDEPTTGLHFDDIAKLLRCFETLLDAGHSVVTIEHNLDVIKCADFIIDLGPGGGEDGGRVVASGTPEEIVKNSDSLTGKVLEPYLKQ